MSTDIDIQPTTDRPRTAYFRKAFNLTNAGAIDSVTLTTRADDGVAVYVNGVEVLRSNLMVGAEHVDYADTAVSTAGAAPRPRSAASVEARRRREERWAEQLNALSDEVIAAELERRGWCCIPPLQDPLQAAPLQDPPIDPG